LIGGTQSKREQKRDNENGPNVKQNDQINGSKYHKKTIQRQIAKRISRDNENEQDVKKGMQISDSK